MANVTALFGGSSGRSQSKNLVEFKAGKMTMKGKMVHPDKRKGLLYVYQSEDSLMHFCWKDRSAGVVEDDLIIFPDDCEFKRVEVCTTGRVYILKFKSSSRKFFFWLQEPKTDKDEDYCKKVNEMLNNPPRSGGGTPDDLHNLLGSMSQQQLVQLFGSFGSGATTSSQLPSNLSSLLGTMNRPSSGNSSSARTSATPDKSSSTSASESARKPATANKATTHEPQSVSTGTQSSQPVGGSSQQSGGSILLSDLQRYLSNMRTTSGSHAPSSIDVDLSDALLDAESIQGVLNDPSLVQELSPHLPDVNTDEPSSERLRSTLMSPQFQQAVSMFSAALRSGQIGPVVQQFRVGEPAVLAACEGNMDEFVRALEKTNINNENKKTEGEGSKKGDKKPDEEKGNDDEKMED